MLHTLLKQVKEYKLPSFLTPVAMIGEVICEMLIPRLMARIVDEGIYAGNMDVILQTGGLMILVAVARSGATDERGGSRRTLLNTFKGK